MSAELVGVFVCLVWVVAIVFLFIGPIVILGLPLVARFSNIQGRLATIQLGKGVRKGKVIGNMCALPLVYYLDQPQLATIDNADQLRSFGNTVILVHHKKRHLSNIIKEMRWYAFLLWVLGTVGLLLQVGPNDLSHPGSILSKIGRHPLEVLALSEGLMLLFLTIRLLIELQSLNELINEQP